MTKATISDLSIARKLVELKESANKRNISFSLSFKKVKQLLTAKKCHYTGIPFLQSKVTQTLGRSIDRIDNELGYHDDNVVASSIMFNSLKSNLSLADLTKALKSVAKANGRLVKITKVKRPRIAKLKVLVA